MKRSEMVSKLRRMSSIIGQGLYTSEEIDRVSSNILATLEDAGMVPPQRLKPVDTALYGNQVITYTPVHEWEPEDE